MLSARPEAVDLSLSLDGPPPFLSRESRFLHCGQREVNEMGWGTVKWVLREGGARGVLPIAPTTEKPLAEARGGLPERNPPEGYVHGNLHYSGLCVICWGCCD